MQRGFVKLFQMEMLLDKFTVNIQEIAGYIPLESFHQGFPKYLGNCWDNGPCKVNDNDA